MAAKAVDEGGHMRVPAHFHVPHESKRHAGREVGAQKRLTLNQRSRGHGPLLQEPSPAPANVGRSTTL